MNEGYIKLWRKSLESGMMRNPHLWTFWCWCLMKATWKPIKQMVGNQMVELMPGQFVFGRKAASEELETGEKIIRTRLDILKNLGNVAIKPTNKFSIITICNWELYQNTDEDNGQQIGQQRANNGPTTGHKQEVKEVKELKEQEEKYMESFDRFWSIYPKKTGKAPCQKKWIVILKSNTDPNAIIIALQNQIRMKYISPEIKYVPMPLTWLNQERWNDEIAETVKCDKCGLITTIYIDDNDECECGGRLRHHEYERKKR